jgi:peptidyl-prolyl cis-trans isomerase B (cyclophilin B)
MADTGDTKPDAPAADAVARRKETELPPIDATPEWVTSSVEFLKKWQNVFYAVATVGLLTWAVVRFRTTQAEKKADEAAFELSQATTTDAIRALLAKYPDDAITPQIKFELAVRLAAEGELDASKTEEALKLFEELDRSHGRTLHGKLAGQRLKTIQDNLKFDLNQKLAGLRKDEEQERDKERIKQGPKIDDKELPTVTLRIGKAGLVIELAEDDAPNAVANFIRQVEKGAYEKTYVYRVEEGLAVFMGDPVQDGSSTPPYTIPFETSKFGPISGVVALVRDLPAEGGADSDALKATACQRFVIFIGDATKYEGKFLTIGRVTGSLDDVRALKTGDVISSVKVTRKRSHEYVPKENPK